MLTLVEELRVTGGVLVMEGQVEGLLVTEKDWQLVPERDTVPEVEGEAVVEGERVAWLADMDGVGVLETQKEALMLWDWVTVAVVEPVMVGVVL